MTKKRIATMATCLALVGAVAVGGTLALLSATSGKVTNTFTVGTGYPGGDLALTVDETNVAKQTDSAQSNFGGYNTTTGDHIPRFTYELVGGTTVDKEPHFHLAANSPDSWIVARVTGIDVLLEKGITVNELDPESNWMWLDTESGTMTPVSLTEEEGKHKISDGYYVIQNVVEKNASAYQSKNLFNSLSIPENINGQADTDNTELGDIEVKGVAVEAVTGIWDNDKNSVITMALEKLK